MARLFIQEMKNLIGILLNFGYDLLRYYKYAFNIREYGSYADEHILAQIMMNAHSIEKGLALESPKVNFGRGVVEKLIGLLLISQSRGHDESHVAIMSALGALDHYRHFHRSKKVELGVLEQKIDQILACHGEPRIGGLLEVSSADIQQDARGDFSMLTNSRHSIRQFTAAPVDLTVLQNAIRLAQRSPSVCNRQSTRAYVCLDKSKIVRLAQFQRGCRGFGESAPCFIVVTSNLTSFATSAERNQAYVDGGIFSMSLMYALHYHGLGVCPLNWCKNMLEDRGIRQEFEINASEEIILMLAVGHMPDKFHVPQSNRDQLESVMRVL